MYRVGTKYNNQGFIIIEITKIHKVTWRHAPLVTVTASILPIAYGFRNTAVIKLTKYITKSRVVATQWQSEYLVSRKANKCHTITSSIKQTTGVRRLYNASLDAMQTYAPSDSFWDQPLIVWILWLTIVISIRAASIEEERKYTHCIITVLHKYTVNNLRDQKQQSMQNVPKDWLTTFSSCRACYHISGNFHVIKFSCEKCS